MLTAKQKELLLYIHERIKETGVSPSFDEMKEALDLASKSGIHMLITALEKRGFLRRLAHRAGGLGFFMLPAPAAPAGGARVRGARPSLVESGGREASEGIPIWGRIAAGAPIEALQNEIGRVPAPAELGSGDHF